MSNVAVGKNFDLRIQKILKDLESTSNSSIVGNTKVTANDCFQQYVPQIFANHGAWICDISMVPEKPMHGVSQQTYLKLNLGVAPTKPLVHPSNLNRRLPSGLVSSNPCSNRQAVLLITT